MTVNASFTTRLMRYGCAVLASSVTTFMGLSVKSHADTMDGCSLRDVAAWQMMLTEPKEEGTPEYILRVTEDFIANCPNRPELNEAHAIAGRAAIDTGDAARAVAHYNLAGPLKTIPEQFAHIAALAAIGDGQTAWALRDASIESWLTELSYDPTTTVSSTNVRGGILHRVQFTYPDRETGVRLAWVAVPDGAGWPATITIGTSRQRSAFHRLRAGENAKPPRHVMLYRCTSRKILARIDDRVSANEIDRDAEVSLISYLSDPDTATRPVGGEPVATCIWPNKMLTKSANR